MYRSHPPVHAQHTCQDVTAQGSLRDLRFPFVVVHMWVRVCTRSEAPPASALRAPCPALRALVRPHSAWCTCGLRVGPLVAGGHCREGQTSKEERSASQGSKEQSAPQSQQREEASGSPPVGPALPGAAGSRPTGGGGRVLRCCSGLPGPRTSPPRGTPVLCALHSGLRGVRAE